MKRFLKDVTEIKAPQKVGDWRGMFVVSMKDVENFQMTFPKDTIFEVVAAGQSKYLKALPCECCGVRGIYNVMCNRNEFLQNFKFVEF